MNGRLKPVLFIPSVHNFIYAVYQVALIIMSTPSWHQPGSAEQTEVRAVRQVQCRERAFFTIYLDLF